MRLQDTLSAALWGALSRPVRTLALVVSLAAGVAAAVFVSMVIAGFGREIDRMAFGSYAHALVVRANALVPDRLGGPRWVEGEMLRSHLPGVQGVAAWKAGPALLQRGGRSMNVTVHGVRGAYQEELDTPLTAGRLLSPAETEGYARVCLVGVELALEFGTSVRVGGRLRVNGAECEIVGVLGEPRSRPAARFTEAVITPLGAAERYFLMPKDARKPGEADRLTLFLPPGTDMETAEMRADLFLRRHRGVSLARPSPFMYGDPNASLVQLQQQRRMLARLLSAVAGLSLLTSLVAFGVIAGSALTSRRREFALRLAMGASGRDIQAQILVESLLVGGIGGCLGLAVGAALGSGTARLWGWPFAFDPIITAVAVGLGLVIGLSVGFVLARRAAALPPALAARG